MSQARQLNLSQPSQQLRIPMPFVPHVLYVAGRAVGHVTRDQNTVSSGRDPSIVTRGTCGPWRLPIDRIEARVTTRARELAVSIRLQIFTLHAMNVQSVELFAAPLLIAVRRQSLDCDLFQ